MGYASLRPKPKVQFGDTLEESIEFSEQKCVEVGQIGKKQNGVHGTIRTTIKHAKNVNFSKYVNRRKLKMCIPMFSRTRNRMVMFSKGSENRVARFCSSVARFSGSIITITLLSSRINVFTFYLYHELPLFEVQCT